MKSDEEIMALVAEAQTDGQNAEKARCAVLEFLRPRMRSYAAKVFPEVLQSRADPSDITQEALIRVDCGFNEFKGTTVGELIVWAQWKVKGKISDYLAKHVEAERQSVSNELSGPANEEFLQLAKSRDLSANSAVSNLETLRANIESLPEETRRVMFLTLMSEMSSSEIAEELGLSIEEVDRLENRALDALRKNTDSAAKAKYS